MIHLRRTLCQSIPGVLLGVILLAGCGHTKGSPASVAPAILPVNRFDALPDTSIRPDGGTCTAASVDLIKQTNGMSLQFTPDAAGFDQMAIRTTDGIYSFGIQVLVPGCTPATDSPPDMVRVTYGLNYVGEFARQNPVCIHASRIDFMAFGITEPGPLDSLVVDAVKNNIHHRVDFALADQENRALNGKPLDDAADPRCDNWIQLPTDAP